MSNIFEDELQLPGSIIEVLADYDSGYDTTSFGTTDSVVIIGTAFNGPVGKVVEVYSPEYAEYIFGSTYDYNVRRSATLVAGIKDAWNTGCRTIYAIRISGEEVYKDFELITESQLRLRVSGLFPSNANKNIYMVYDNTSGAETIKIYKPAERATISEKKNGMVENITDVLVCEFDLANTYGFTKDSRLTELITALNNYSNNNVLKLSIVDKNGVDVTLSDDEAQNLSVGAIFPGAYFIGRDKNVGITAYTDVQHHFVTDEASKPFSTFKDNVFKELVINTDINADYPIYAKSKADLNSMLTSVVMSEMFDFLKVAGKVDEVFGKDDVDYEGIEISNFDIYKKLGSGYAITAKAITATDDNGNLIIKKVKETPSSDPNRIAGISNGIYSMLENLNSNYRVLTCGNADDIIADKLPKKSDFKMAAAKSVSLTGNIEIESIIDEKDFSASKQYEFVIGKMSDEDIENAALNTVKANIYTKHVIKAISTIAASELDAETSIPESTMIMIVDTDETKNYLGRVINGKVVKLVSAENEIIKDTLFASKEDGTTLKLYKANIENDNVELVEAEEADIDTKTYVMINHNKVVYIYKVDTMVLSPIGSLNEVLNNNEDKTFITIQDEFGSKNTITIKSTEFDYATIEEFVDLLNSDANLSKLFLFSLTQEGIVNKDELIEDILTLDTTDYTVTLAKNKELTYNTNLYIPYKTTDNFARQLAQHCTLTEMKTGKTHGVIGCTMLKDVNLTAVANKVNKALTFNFDLFAKKANGKNILNEKNETVPVGKNISIVFGQYSILTDDYNYISNGAAGYAGMVSNLALDQSSTNQPITIPTPMYDLTNYQLTKLTAAGFVTFKNSITKGIVVTDGVTQAPSESVYRRLSVTRVVGAVEQAIRNATEPYIGQQNHLTNRNAMKTAIKSNLETLKGTLINDFSFEMFDDPTQAKFGIIRIDYAIIPVYEIRQVINTIKIV